MRNFVHDFIQRWVSFGCASRNLAPSGTYKLFMVVARVIARGLSSGRLVPERRTFAVEPPIHRISPDDWHAPKRREIRHAPRCVLDRETGAGEWDVLGKSPTTRPESSARSPGGPIWLTGMESDRVRASAAKASP